jgi:Bacterial regulatory proteins, luxR family
VLTTAGRSPRQWNTGRLCSAREEALAAAGRDEPIIFLTGHGDVPTCAKAMKVGAIGGKLNKQIAAHLGAGEKTVKVHRGRVMRKMGVVSIAELVRLTQKVGIGPESEKEGTKAQERVSVRFQQRYGKQPGNLASFFSVGVSNLHGTPLTPLFVLLLTLNPFRRLQNGRTPSGLKGVKNRVRVGVPWLEFNHDTNRVRGNFRR